ncbi:MAG: hypothetical protein Q9216_003058 [Gyalolechia sp. 2 TL-2023]
MDEDISPTSSRATTPVEDKMNVTELQLNMDALTELSNRFQQHRLDPYAHEIDASTLSPPTLDIEPPTLPLRASRRRRSSSLLIWQQRQNMSRRQCTPTHVSQIAKLVDQLSHDVNPGYNATHPSSHCRSPVSPTSSPSSFHSLDSTPSSSGSEDSGCGHDSLSRRLVANKISKESRRGAAVDALEKRQPKLVLKKVRMRKSLVRLRTAA